MVHETPERGYIPLMAEDGRGQESKAERLDRNWQELVQELRVAQTGIQVLAGFLLTLPFSQRFGDLGSTHRTVYLVAFSLAVLTVGLMTAPVAIHRFLFQQHAKDTIVFAGDTLAKLGLASLGSTLVTVVLLIFMVVVGDTAGIIAASVVAVFFVLAWAVLPLALLEREGD